VRHDGHGDVTDLDAIEMHRHAPLVTLLRYGKRLEQMELAVRMSVSFTEVGTLELWCESVSSPHRWRLQFELRGNAESQTERTKTSAAAASAPIVSEAALQPALDRIRATFPKSASEAHDPATLVSDLEAMLDLKRDGWPLSAVRGMADALLQAADGRNLSTKHEARWLNLLGFCLRPGFGDADDPRRMTQMRRINQGGLTFRDNLQNQVDWLVLWRRVSGGLSAAQHNELRNYLGTLGIARAKKGPRLNAQLERESWRLLASLEHLSGATRAALGNDLLRKLKKEPVESAWLWALGRFGTRIPLYGSLTCVVPHETAEQWVTAIVDGRELAPEAAAAVAQLARMTGDRSRDLSEAVREHAIARLQAAEVTDEQLLAPLQSVVVTARADVARTFGEPLPRGIVLESTTDCLSPVSAITTA
jgi:hypothetical protein